MTVDSTEPRLSEAEQSRPGTPKRVLILSGEMGEGHNAAAAAITEAIADVWPGCEVERFDTLELWGHPFAKAASWGYEVQMRAVPFTYEIFYEWLIKSDRFANLTKSAIGRFFGRRLQKYLANRDDDLIISTYPFGSAALDWLRTHNLLPTPTVTYIPAFHVHPVWAYSGIDQHYVMYDSAPSDARTVGFETTMRVAAPPVRDAFGTVPKETARERLDVKPDDFVLLVTGGAWGLGGVEDAVQALVESDIPGQVLAVCGKNTELVTHLESLGIGRDRLRVFGYVTNMHELMAAADVVVTNGAGVTVLEGLCTSRPVIAFQPLAGHGKASTAELARRNLAVPAEDVPELVKVVRRLAGDEVQRNRMQEAGRKWSEGRDMRAMIRQMETLV